MILGGPAGSPPSAAIRLKVPAASAAFGARLLRSMRFSCFLLAWPTIFSSDCWTEVLRSSEASLAERYSLPRLWTLISAICPYFSAHSVTCTSVIPSMYFSSFPTRAPTNVFSVSGISMCRPVIWIFTTGSQSGTSFTTRRDCYTDSFSGSTEEYAVPHDTWRWCAGRGPVPRPPGSLRSWSRKGASWDSPPPRSSGCAA